MGVLETALKLAHQDADAEDEEEGGQRAAAAKVETTNTSPDGLACLMIC